MTGKKPKTRPMKPSQSLEIQSTGLPDGVIELAASLPRPEECLDQTELTLWIRAGTYVFVSGLVLLAAWRHTLPDQCIVRLDDTGCNERVRRLITAAGTHQSLARQPPNDSAPASPARLLGRYQWPRAAHKDIRQVGRLRQRRRHQGGAGRDEPEDGAP
ncbi:MAG: hypothetical protein SVU69_13205, partial [Pseudomonadota bacterium]|nr:hypothetical protein [Pseudomonadota bacterium]